MKDEFDSTSVRISGSPGDALVSAAMRLDPEAVCQLIAEGAPVDFSDNWPLRGTVHQLLDMPGRDPARVFACAELLLEAGAADVASEQALLTAALRASYAPLAHRLLSRDIDIEPVMRGIGYNKMVIAATFGFEELVEKFHREGATPPPAYEEALSAAAEHGHARLVDRMLDYNVDTAKVDIVFCAVVGGQTDLVKSLVARGHTTDFKCPVLLEAVIEGNHGAMMDYLLDQGADRSKAHETYISFSNRWSKPYAEIHETLKKWSEREQTVIYAIPNMTTLAELRETEQDHRGHPTSLLVRLSKINRIDDALTLARASVNDRLGTADLLARDSAGNSVIEILGSRGQLGKVFAPDLWENRQADFATLYAHVAPVYQGQVDYQGLVSTWRRRALSAVKDKIPRLKRG